ncbi:hypothetical protein [Bacillus mycoides]|uniref:hypothetical protein n=2 Tax=Bacillus cereus group TaxID=86661 RepID=UPI001C01AAD8|nr:hypothetical protein [Bacillus mycoides]QWI48366.1 hypothetical protein EXW56_05285 [Bacillus mycoides]
MKDFDRKDHVDKVEEEEKLEAKKEKSIEKESKNEQAYNFDKYNEQFEGRKQETIEDGSAENTKNISFDKYQKQLNKEVKEQQNERDAINPELDSPEVMEEKKIVQENTEGETPFENLEETENVEGKEKDSALENPEGTEKLEGKEKDAELENPEGKEKDSTLENLEETENVEGKEKDSALENPEGTENVEGKEKDSALENPEGTEKLEGKEKDAELENPEGTENVEGKEKDSTLENLEETENVEGKEKDSALENPEGTENVEGKEKDSALENPEGTEKLEGKEKDSTLENLEETENVEGKEKDSALENPEGTENVEGKEKDSALENPEGTEKLEGKEKDAELENPEENENVEGKEKDSTLENPEGTGNVEGKEKDSTLENLEETENVEGKEKEKEKDSALENPEGTENVEGKEKSSELENLEGTEKLEVKEKDAELEDPEGTENLEGKEKSSGLENPEETENVEGKEKDSALENPEETGNVEEKEKDSALENPEGTENVEGKEKSSELENLEGTENLEVKEKDAELENPEGTENLEGKEKDAELENPEGTENVEGKEKDAELENPEGTENVEGKEKDAELENPEGTENLEVKEEDSALENPEENENVEETPEQEVKEELNPFEQVEEETAKTELEQRSETEEESGFDLDALLDQKKKEIDQRTIGQILKERKDAWREAGYGDSFKEMWKNAIQAQIDAKKEGRWLKYNAEEFSKEIKNVYEDGMKLANKVIENNKILGPIKEVLEERNKKWNEAGEGKYTLKSSIEAQIEAAKQGPKAWWEYNKKEFSKEIKTAYEDCAKMADKITDNYKTLANIKVSLEERHEKRIEAGEGATLLEMCKNSVRAQIDAAKEGPKGWLKYNAEEFSKEIKNVYEDGVKIADKITDTYKVIANAKISLRERHEKRIEDGEGATLMEMCKNSVRAQIDAAKEGRWLKYNAEEFSKEIKNVYEDSMKVANKMIESNKILFSIKEVAIEREKIWSEAEDGKYTLKYSIKAQIEAIKQGPAEWFKYNKEEFSKEIKTVYEDSMKVANKIIDKYKPLADARDVLEARDKKWREAGEANTITSSWKAQLEAAKQGPKAWWEYTKKGFGGETRHLFEDGKSYLIKYMDTPGLFDEVDDKASEKKDDKKKVREIEREGIENQVETDDSIKYKEQLPPSFFDQMMAEIESVEETDYKKLVAELREEISLETARRKEEEDLKKDSKQEVRDTFIDSAAEAYVKEDIVEEVLRVETDTTLGETFIDNLGEKISSKLYLDGWEDVKKQFTEATPGLLSTETENTINEFAEEIQEVKVDVDVSDLMDSLQGNNSILAESVDHYVKGKLGVDEIPEEISETLQEGIEEIIDELASEVTEWLLGEIVPFLRHVRTRVEEGKKNGEGDTFVEQWKNAIAHYKELIRRKEFTREFAKGLGEEAKNVGRHVTYATIAIPLLTIRLGKLLCKRKK